TDVVVAARRDKEGQIHVVYEHEGGLFTEDETLDLEHLPETVKMLQENLCCLKKQNGKDREFAEYALTLSTLYHIGYQESPKRLYMLAEDKKNKQALEKLRMIHNQTEQAFAAKFMHKKTASDQLALRRAKIIGSLGYAI